MTIVEYYLFLAFLMKLHQVLFPLTEAMHVVHKLERIFENVLPEIKEGEVNK